MKLKQTIVDILPILIGRKNILSLRYYHQRNRMPNLKHPQNISEIILANVLRGYYDKYAPLEDKILVRDYIRDKGLERILLEHYFTWDNAEDIKLELLPDKFVLKTNNGASGKNIFICRDKSAFDIEAAKLALGKALRKKNLFEKQYNLIDPKIICEELVDTGSNAWPTDYKFTCIHGNIVDIFIGTEREKGVRFCTKNMNWETLPYTKEAYLPNQEPKKPSTLKEMVEIAKILSKDFPFVRVDLYEYHNQVFFSELTFTPWGGLMYSYTDEAIEKYGKLIKEHPTDYV